MNYKAEFTEFLRDMWNEYKKAGLAEKITAPFYILLLVIICIFAGFFALLKYEYERLTEVGLNE